ncbi:coiled-coil domain-containing protein 62 isoform X2 [Trichomycterus rosablanca]|uniref:coiled-coil domain-containing protein 62 isoform X2 n=1 Tax=Trichomycterus rosablanca TaxID=2290929 RepID=UPI002F35F80D
MSRRATAADDVQADDDPLFKDGMDEDRRNNDAQSRTFVNSFIPSFTNGFPLDPWHSTPVKKTKDASMTRYSTKNSSNHQASSSVIQGTERTNEASVPRSSAKSTYSPSNHQVSFSAMQGTETPANELEITTIQKQRNELHLLIAELKDRDQELNSMAASHHCQIQAWEQDRQRVLTLEQKCARLEDELQKRNEVIRAISKRLKMAEGREKDSHRELSCIQHQLQELSQRQLHSSQKHQDLEERNQSLNSTILTLSSQFGQLQVHEEELNSMLKLKDKDLMEATNHILSLTDRLRELETSLKASQAHERKLLRETEEYKRRFRDARRDNTQLKDNLQEKTLENNSQREELIRLKQENQILRKELSLAGEGESWKDELIALARSKQERTESELLCLRQVCENQQNDLHLLKLNHDSTRETLRQYESQMTLEKIGNVTGPSALEHSNYKGTVEDQLIGECSSRSIDVPPISLQHPKHLNNHSLITTISENLASNQNTVSEDFTSFEIKGQDRNSKTSKASAEPGSTFHHCRDCGNCSSENSAVDLIAIINNSSGTEESVLLVDFSPKDQHCSCSGNVTCVYVDCATPSPRRQLSPGLEDSAFSTTAKSNQEFTSSTSRLQRLLAESQQMVASLERSSGKPLSETSSPALSSTPNPSPSPVLSPTPRFYSVCSPTETVNNRTSRSHTQSPENGRQQARMEDENGRPEIQKISSSQNLSSGLFDCSLSVTASDSGLPH